MIKLAVLDNEEQILNYICNYINSLQELSAKLDIQKFVTAEALLQTMDEGEVFDIVLSDIELDHLQGIDFGKIVREKY